MNAEGTASRDREGWRAFHLQGMADGHVLALDLGPVNGQRVLAISCDDFGKALKSLGFTNTVQDGALSIHGVSSPDNPRVIVGDIKIGAFKVRQLPVLALLLNATSPLGITGLLTDSAEFDRLKGKFRWEGDRLDLQHVRLAGAAMDMTLDGRVDLASGQADLGGSLAPFSTVNRLLGYVPLLGDIVTGDGGGVLAVRYGIKGPLADPKVSVNPLSLLTPGALRNLFFGGEDDAFVPEEKNAPPVETNFNKKP